MPRSWIAVASAEHVRRGRAGGFMQVCHGQVAPLRGIRPGDGVIYYSPTATFGGRDRFQTFTALGVVGNRDPYRATMGSGFTPWRLDVDWHRTREAPIRPLLEQLSFTAATKGWGARLRFGLLAITEADFDRIGVAMGLSSRFQNVSESGVGESS